MTESLPSHQSISSISHADSKSELHDAVVLHAAVKSVNESGSQPIDQLEEHVPMAQSCIQSSPVIVAVLQKDQVCLFAHHCIKALSSGA